jgi:hypothetical protein
LREDCGDSGWEAGWKKLKGCRGSSKILPDGGPPEERNRFAANVFCAPFEKLVSDDASIALRLLFQNPSQNPFVFTAILSVARR